MKRKSNVISGMFALAAILCLILDGQTAITGGSDGVALCLQSVIPSLFPFFVITPLLIVSIEKQAEVFLKPFASVLHLSPKQIPYFISGLLGGYPVGAKNIRDGYMSGELSHNEAVRMLSFCCNAGPAFLFGICGGLFQSRWTPWFIWMIHIISSFIIGITIPGSSSGHTNRSDTQITLMQSFQNAIRSIAGVCGWVILFKVYLAIAEKWILWYLPQWLKTALIGFMELTNGCISLYQIPGEDIRFLLCCVFIGFGGVCVWMQTLFVLQPLSAKPYLLGKIWQTIISFLLALLVVAIKNHMVMTAVSSIIILLMLIFVTSHCAKKITVAIQKEIMYNKTKIREVGYAVSKEN